MRRLLPLAFLAMLLLAPAAAAGEANVDAADAAIVGDVTYAVCLLIFSGDPHHQYEYCDKPRGGT